MSEIKEILEAMAKIEFHGADLALENKDLKILLDYITNLQQENEMYAQLKDEYEEEIKDLHQENQMLKQSNKNTYETSQEMLAELTQENERLKRITYNPDEKNNKWIEEESELKKVYRERNDYKSRCEKASELLKTAGCYDEDTKSFCDDIWYELPDLLNILQNGDSE